MLPEILFWKYT